MIPNEQGLLREITLKHDSDFHYLYCLHLFRVKTNLNRIKNHLEIKIFAVL